MINYVSFVFSLTTIGGVNISNTYQPMTNNVIIPSMGFSAYSKNEDRLVPALEKALEVGYRHIDTSALYENEHIVGHVVNKWISSKKVKRRDLFITTKFNPFEVSPDLVEEALNTSLKKLGLKFVNSYIIHLPVGVDKQKHDINENKLPFNLTELWKKMEEQVHSKRTRSIGLANFNKKQIKEILSFASIPPSNLYTEIHPYHQQKDLLDFCKKHNILVVSFAPLGPLQEYRESSKNDILEDTKVLELSQRYKKHPAQVVLRFMHEMLVAMVPRTTDLNLIEYNSKIFKFRLNHSDVQILDALDKGADGQFFHLNN